MVLPLKLETCIDQSRVGIRQQSCARWLSDDTSFRLFSSENFLKDIFKLQKS